jgi:DNA polymerase-1
VIEFDVETTNLQWYGPTGELFLTSFQQDGAAFLHRHPEGRAYIQSALNAKDGYRAWNAKFDLHWLRQSGYELPPEDQWHDGMVMAHLMDANRSVALKARGELLFGSQERDLESQVKDFLSTETKRRRKAAKADGSEFVRPNYSDVPEDVMREYAAQDVSLQRRICDVYEKAMPADLRELYELERQTLAALFWMEDRGIPVDRDAAIRLEASLANQHDELWQRAVDKTVPTFNPGSPQQIGEALERAGADLRFVTKTPTGQLKTDEENLGAVDHPLAETILEYRGAQKMYSTMRAILHGPPDEDAFPDPYLAPDGRLHPNFRQVGARTGRMSCSNPNVQNWHRDDLRMRYLVAAGEGKKLVTADLDAIEMRIFAAFCGEGALLDAIKRGEDMHALAATRAGLGERRRSTGAVETARQRGKVLNYSICYGAGKRSLRKAFGVDQKGAGQILDRYHAAFPEVSMLQNKIEFALEDQGYVRSAWGRRFRVERNASREAYKFTNYLVQGTAADLLKDALVTVHKAGVPVVAVVHDEIVAEVDESDAREAAHIIEQALTDQPRLTEAVPIEAEAQIVDRWSDAKTPGYVPDYMEES